MDNCVCVSTFSTEPSMCVTLCEYYYYDCWLARHTQNNPFVIVIGFGASVLAWCPLVRTQNCLAWVLRVSLCAARHSSTFRKDVHYVSDVRVIDSVKHVPYLCTSTFRPLRPHCRTLHVYRLMSYKPARI